MKHIIAATLLSMAMTAAFGQESSDELSKRSGVRQTTTDRIVVKWRAATSTALRSQKSASIRGVTIQRKESFARDIEVLQTREQLGGAQLNEIIETLEADPDVEYASPDMVREAHALSSDPLLLTEQWYLLSQQTSATRTELAWDITKGNASTIVAVLDTGVRREHPDLAGKLIEGGYDFVTDIAVANDSDARDANPEDPGDWINALDRQNLQFAGCRERPSSWHGTRVSGLIGALTDNSVGLAGAAWNTRILPVRVLGKCGGRDTDIVAGMLWAAGLPVAGAPTNPNPAKIINLSLGGSGPCTSFYQNAVNQITASGVLIVASAGNEGSPVSAPANCTGVMGVAGVRHFGSKVGYSNLGTEVGLAAPAGNCVNITPGSECLFSIIVPIDTGTTVPVGSGYTDRINANYGTSFSAPLVAAAAALMHSVNSTLTPAQTVTLLKQTSSAFPVNSAVGTCRVPSGPNDIQDGECNCTTQTCGAGMLNTGAAVSAAQQPFAVISRSGNVTVGSTVTLDGSGSFAPNGRTITSFQWSIVNLTGSQPTITSPTQSTTTLQITGASQFTVRLTISDGQGGQDTEDLPLATPATQPPPTPPASSGGGGGGGQLGWEILCLGLLALRRIGVTAKNA